MFCSVKIDRDETIEEYHITGNRQCEEKRADLMAQTNTYSEKQNAATKATGSSGFEENPVPTEYEVRNMQGIRKIDDIFSAALDNKLATSSSIYTRTLHPHKTYSVSRCNLIDPIKKTDIFVMLSRSETILCDRKNITVTKNDALVNTKALGCNEFADCASGKRDNEEKSCKNKKQLCRRSGCSLVFRYSWNEKRDNSKTKTCQKPMNEIEHTLKEWMNHFVFRKMVLSGTLKRSDEIIDFHFLKSNNTQKNKTTMKERKKVVFKVIKKLPFAIPKKRKKRMYINALTYYLLERLHVFNPNKCLIHRNRCFLNNCNQFSKKSLFCNQTELKNYLKEVLQDFLKLSQIVMDTRKISQTTERLSHVLLNFLKSEWFCGKECDIYVENLKIFNVIIEEAEFIADIILKYLEDMYRKKYDDNKEDLNLCLNKYSPYTKISNTTLPNLLKQHMIANQASPSLVIDHNFSIARTISEGNIEMKDNIATASFASNSVNVTPAHVYRVEEKGIWNIKRKSGTDEKNKKKGSTRSSTTQKNRCSNSGSNPGPSHNQTSPEADSSFMPATTKRLKPPETLKKELNEYIMQWINEIPIYSCDPDIMNQVETIRKGFYFGVWDIIQNLEGCDEAFHNPGYYQDLFDEMLEELYDCLPESDELNARKQHLKVSLMKKVIKTEQKMRLWSNPEYYKEILRKHAKIPIDKPRTAIVDETGEDMNKQFEEIQVMNIVDTWILLQNFKQDPTRVNILRNKLISEAAKYIEMVQGTQGKELKDVNTLDYIDCLQKKLAEVPFPSDDTISEEGDTILIAQEIDEWWKELPVAQTDVGHEELKRRRARDRLAKNIHNMEKSLDFTQDSSAEKALRGEISIFLQKLPLTRDQSLNINTMVEVLTNRIKNRQIRPGERKMDYNDSIQYKRFTQNIPLSSSIHERPGATNQINESSVDQLEINNRTRGTNRCMEYNESIRNDDFKRNVPLSSSYIKNQNTQFPEGSIHRAVQKYEQRPAQSSLPRKTDKGFSFDPPVSSSRHDGFGWGRQQKSYSSPLQNTNTSGSFGIHRDKDKEPVHGQHNCGICSNELDTTKGGKMAMSQHRTTLRSTLQRPEMTLDTLIQGSPEPNRISHNKTTNAHNNQISHRCPDNTVSPQKQNLYSAEDEKPTSGNKAFCCPKEKSSEPSYATKNIGSPYETCVSQGPTSNTKSNQRKPPITSKSPDRFIRTPPTQTNAAENCHTTPKSLGYGKNNNTIDQSNPNEPITQGRRRPPEELFNELNCFIYDWIKQVPIISCNHQIKAQEDNLRKGLYGGLWSIINELHDVEALYDNLAYYECVFGEKLEELFNCLPESEELSRKKPALKASLGDKVKYIMMRLKLWHNPDYYNKYFKVQSNKCGTCKPRTAVKDKNDEDLDKQFEDIQEIIIVDMWLRLNNLDEKSIKMKVFRKNLLTEAAKCIEGVKAQYGTELRDIDPKHYVPLIEDSLANISPPSKKTINDGADLALLELQIDEWWQQLPLAQAGGEDELFKRKMIRDRLARRIHDMELTLDLTHDCTADRALKGEVSQILQLIPLTRDECLNINDMVDELANKIKNRRTENCECVNEALPSSNYQNQNAQFPEGSIDRAVQKCEQRPLPFSSLQKTDRNISFDPPMTSARKDGSGWEQQTSHCSALQNTSGSFGMYRDKDEELAYGQHECGICLNESIIETNTEGRMDMCQDKTTLGSHLERPELTLDTPIQGLPEPNRICLNKITTSQSNQKCYRSPDNMTSPQNQNLHLREDERPNCCYSASSSLKNKGPKPFGPAHAASHAAHDKGSPYKTGVSKCLSSADAASDVAPSRTYKMFKDKDEELAHGHHDCGVCLNESIQETTTGGKMDMCQDKITSDSHLERPELTLDTPIQGAPETNRICLNKTTTSQSNLKCHRSPDNMRSQQNKNLHLREDERPNCCNNASSSPKNKGPKPCCPALAASHAAHEQNSPYKTGVSKCLSSADAASDVAPSSTCKMYRDKDEELAHGQRDCGICLNESIMETTTGGRMDMFQDKTTLGSHLERPELTLDTPIRCSPEPNRIFLNKTTTSQSNQKCHRSPDNMRSQQNKNLHLREDERPNCCNNASSSPKNKGPKPCCPALAASHAAHEQGSPYKTGVSKCLSSTDAASDVAPSSTCKMYRDKDEELAHGQRDCGICLNESIMETTTEGRMDMCQDKTTLGSHLVRPELTLDTPIRCSPEPNRICPNKTTTPQSNQMSHRSPDNMRSPQNKNLHLSEDERPNCCCNVSSSPKNKGPKPFGPAHAASHAAQEKGSPYKTGVSKCLSSAAASDVAPSSTYKKKVLRNNIQQSGEDEEKTCFPEKIRCTECSDISKDYGVPSDKQSSSLSVPGKANHQKCGVSSTRSRKTGPESSTGSCFHNPLAKKYQDDCESHGKENVLDYQESWCLVPDCPRNQSSQTLDCKETVLKSQKSCCLVPDCPRNQSPQACKCKDEVKVIPPRNHACCCKGNQLKCCECKRVKHVSCCILDESRIGGRYFNDSMQ